MSKKNQTKTVAQEIVTAKNKATINKTAWLPYLIVFCIPVLLYIHTLSFKFTNFDDDHLISDNIVLLSDLANAPQMFLKEAFIDKSGHFYRPMQALSYMIDIKLSGGNNTTMFHFSNVFLLGLIACLLYSLLIKFLIPKKLALLSTLLYCVHPLFVSSISWIPARGDLMLMLFTLLSFLCLIDWIQSKRMKYLLLHWITFSLALFCKETAAFLPFLFIVYYIMFHYNKESVKLYLFVITMYVFSGIVWFYLRSMAIGNYSDPNDLIGISALIDSLQVIPESISSFFIPFGIIEFPVFSLFKTAIGGVITVVIIILFSRNKETSKKEMFFGLMWFLILLLPSLFFKNTQIDYLNHRFFLPLIGILFFVLYAIPQNWFEKGDIKNSWIIVIVIAVFSFLTYGNSRSYANPTLFYANATSRSSVSSLAYYNMGNVLKNNRANPQQIINYYTKAIEKQPNYSEAYNNRGNIYLQQKLYDKAISDYDKAIEYKPDYADAYYDRGSAYNGKGMYDKGISDFTKTIELAPDYARAYNNRGFAYFNKMFYDKAIIDYTKAIKIKPDYARAYNNRGNAYYKQGLNDKGDLDLKKAKELSSH